MKISRREFLDISLTSAAGLSVGGFAFRSPAAELPVALLDEDGYKLWLRHAPPGDAVKSNVNIVRHIRVEGTSATCGIIRDELRSATAAMIGTAVTAGEMDLPSGSVIVGTPENSALTSVNTVSTRRTSSTPPPRATR